MKKLSLILFCSLFVGRAATAQTNPDTLVFDTLHYYFNKYHFKTGTLLQNFQFYKSAAATVTNVTHCGSKFENPYSAGLGDTLWISGLEAFVAKHVKTANLSIPVRLYLCTLDVNGKPKLPPLDSVSATVGSTMVVAVGGPLHKVWPLTTDFAVLFRNISTIAGDTLHLLRTAGATSTNSGALQSQKCSDGFGYIRYAGNFLSTTNYTNSQGFGVGTDYEFCVAPWVSYWLHAGQQLPSQLTNTPPDTICTFQYLTFTNASSKRYSHRQYNLNEFYRKWNLYSPFVASPQGTGGWSGDSSITWKFESEDAIDGRIFLGYGQGPQPGTNGTPNTIKFATDSVNPDTSCFTANQFRARLRPMSIYGRRDQYIYNEDFTVCTKYCNGDALLVRRQDELSNMRLYPNPTADGRTVITGLAGSTQVIVYDIVGKELMRGTTDKDRYELNLQSQPAGTYFVKLSTGTASRVTKVIKN